MSDDDTLKLYVSGHSDDLVEVDGGRREEFSASYGEATHLIVGETEVSAEYTADGEWSVQVVDQGERDETSWYPVGNQKVVERLNDYTEVVMVETPTADVRMVTGDE